MKLTASQRSFFLVVTRLQKIFPSAKQQERRFYCPLVVPLPTTSRFCQMPLLFGSPISSGVPLVRRRRNGCRMMVLVLLERLLSMGLILTLSTTAVLDMRLWSIGSESFLLWSRSVPSTSLVPPSARYPTLNSVMQSPNPPLTSFGCNSITLLAVPLVTPSMVSAPASTLMTGWMSSSVEPTRTQSSMWDCLRAPVQQERDTT